MEEVKTPQDIENVVSNMSYYIAAQQASITDKLVESIVPKLWLKIAKSGKFGAFIAGKFIKVIIVTGALQEKELVRNAKKECLYRLQAYGHGGGNYRRLIETELANLDLDEPDEKES